ncbi:MAG: hypothetical protein RI516_08080 [Spiribacter sp.]|nr:hypothetical protein [Spiribacter sp.]
MWYFTAFYSILRAIPDKFGGVTSERLIAPETPLVSGSASTTEL